jgi:hypothetical protein
VKVRFLGLNFKVGYAYPVTKDLMLGIQTGMYYTTMFVPTVAGNEKFGFQNLMGPQLYPVIRYGIGAHSVSAYMKYSPVGENSNIKSLANRELAGGLGWAMPLGQTRRFSVNLDAADLSLSFEDIVVKSQSLSLSAGVSW